MKRYGNLFDQAFTHNALVQAFHDAAKHKLSKYACYSFGKNLSININDLHKELHSNTYKPQPYFKFNVYEPKERIIYAPAFRDCVVQHAIYKVIEPIFEAVFIDQSYACRKGFGTHKAADYAQHALQLSKSDSYTLKLDIRKFFYRIDQTILKRLIEQKIKDQRMVSMMMLFTDYGSPIGIPIGNLLSQIFALIYLNPLDHYIKRELKVKLYCRYVDDFILFNLTKDQALDHLQTIKEFIDIELHLELSKFTLAKTSKGVNFVGYRTWANKRFIRKRSLYNFKRSVKLKKLDSIISLLGHARRTHTLNYLLKTIKNKHLALYLQLPKIYGRIKN
jgi:RNA-directed DNA polymerase